MPSTLNPKPTDDPHDVIVVAPDLVRVTPPDEELSNLLRAAARHLSDRPTPAQPDASPAVDTTFRPAAVNDVMVPLRRRWIGRSAARALTALLLAACIGLAAAMWPSYGDAAKEIIAKWAPQFALASPLPVEQPALSVQPAAPAVEADAADATAPQPAAPALSASAPSASAPVAPAPVAPAVAALPPESAQLLSSMARDLANVGQQVEELRAAVEQLKAGQQQMSRDVAKVSEVKPSEQKPRPRISAVVPRPATPARKPIASFPPPKFAAAPASPQAAAPSVPLQPEPPSPATVPPPNDPELASVPRPPMPLR